MGDRWTAQEMRRLWAYDEFAALVYADRRLVGPVRDLILLMGWMLYRDPTAPNGDYQGRWWQRVQELTDGAASEQRRPGRWWPGFRQVIADDLPAYWGARYTECAGRCEGPRIRPYRARPPAWRSGCLIPTHPHRGDCRFSPARAAELAAEEREEAGLRDGVCGEPTSAVHVVERDQTTGRDRIHWFCRRHEDAAARLRLDLEVPNRRAPEPVPDRGGLLPCYLRYAGDPDGTEWVGVYRWASGRRDWIPPVYGVRADDWPDPDSADDLVPVPRRPELVVLPGGLLDAVREGDAG